MAEESKACKMKRWSILASINVFLDRLGFYPKTDEDWEAAYDLFMEERKDPWMI